MQDAIENISQRYIEHLRVEKKKAEDRLDVANQRLSAASESLTEAIEWEDLLKTYWERVKTVEKTYHNIEKMLKKAATLAKVITSNTGYVAESTEALVCIVREMSAQTDGLKHMIHHLKNKLSTVEKNNTYLKKILAFEEKVDDALKTNSEAIISVLDLLKEVYRLHVYMLGKSRDLPHVKKFIVRLADDCQHFWVGDDSFMEFFYEIIVIIRLEKKVGLEDNIKELLCLLDRDNAYTHLSQKEEDALPLPLPTEKPPTFPLHELAYYKNTKCEYEEAGDRLKTVTNRQKQMAEHAQTRQAQLDGIKAALAAAEKAKAATKV
jgi:archaellum component FlaC